MSEKLPILNFERQYMNNSKVGREVATKQVEIDENITEMDIVINDSIINLVNLWSDKHITLSDNSITPFDMAVMDAAYTIMCSGYHVIAAEWIAKVLTGNPEQRATQKRLEEIRNSIDKLRCIHIKIDYTSEYNAYCCGEKASEKIKESYLLPLDKDTTVYESNGKKVVVYRVLRKPVLYEYAEFNKQIIDVPANLMDTSLEFNDTDEAILIKRYVIKRVAQIISNNRLSSNKISFLWFDKDEKRGLFPELGYEPDNTKAWRVHKQKSTK